ncbi:MAG: AAA family ATPase, partial [Bacilli bacterium]
MVESISIDNYALIDKSVVNFKKGFTVITGETGAGKSIMIGALGLTLGERSDVSVIPNKKRKCIVEVVYDITNYNLEIWFNNNNLDFSTHVIVRRELRQDGRSRGFINDTPVSNKILKEFGGFMIDIHSQHKSLLIGRPEFQTEILDLFCGNSELLKEYSNFYKKRELLIDNLKKSKAELIKEENDRDYLNFRYNQLDKA